jgi:hypothetical protein
MRLGRAFARASDTQEPGPWLQVDEALLGHYWIRQQLQRPQHKQHTRCQGGNKGFGTARKAVAEAPCARRLQEVKLYANERQHRKRETARQEQHDISLHRLDLTASERHRRCCKDCDQNDGVGVVV